MPKKLYKLPKLKNKDNKRGYQIANPDGSSMEVVAIRVFKGEQTNQVYVEVEYIADEKQENQSV